jgi:hypothetical protein
MGEPYFVANFLLPARGPEHNNRFWKLESPQSSKAGQSDGRFLCSSCQSLLLSHHSECQWTIVPDLLPDRRPPGPAEQLAQTVLRKGGIDIAALHNHMLDE